MKAQAIFLIVLVSAFATSDIFAEIKESEFGSTLAATIEMELESNTEDNIGHVIHMVKEVRKGIRDQQQELKDKYDETADECRAEMDSFDRKIDALEAKVTKNNRLIMIDQPVLDDRISERQNKREELKARKATRKALNGENDRMIEAFNAEVAEHNAVRTMMHQARNIMREAFGSEEANFLQTQTSALSKLSSHIKSFKTEKNGLAHGYAQVFNVIAMIAERAPVQGDSGMVDTIFRIFDDIEDNLETSLSITRTAEKQRLEMFKELRQRLTKEIKSLKKRIAGLNTEILALKLSVNAYNENVDTATEAIEDANTLRTDKETYCGNEDRVYQMHSNAMQQEITTCGNAIYLMEDKRELLERFRQ